MKWSNLQDGDCPQCGSTLKYEEHKRIFTCGCSFAIGRDKFEEITSRQAERFGKPKRHFGQSDEEARQEELNNLQL